MRRNFDVTRTEAVVRLVLARRHGQSVVVDALLVTSDGEPWPAKWQPLALHLGLPDATWMADALALLLEEWAGEDALAAVALISTGSRTVARIGCGQSVVSLELLEQVAA